MVSGNIAGVTSMTGNMVYVDGKVYAVVQGKGLTIINTDTDTVIDTKAGGYTEETFHFYSDSYLVNNPVYSSVSEIFDDKSKFLWESENIAKHLFEAAENPRVQGGELFIVYFEDEREGTERVDKIGIFKTEKRESFLKISPNDETFDIEKDQGIGLSKIDKAALIYNNDKETGYVLSVVDNNKN